MNEEEKQKKINDILNKIISKEEIIEYNKLGSSLGIMYGLLYSLEQEGILKAFGDDGIKKIKDGMEVITLYTQKGMESTIGKDKSDKIIEELIKSNLV